MNVLEGCVSTWKKLENQEDSTGWSVSVKPILGPFRRLGYL
jgi:hypothetical protein